MRDNRHISIKNFGSGWIFKKCQFHASNTKINLTNIDSNHSAPNRQSNLKSFVRKLATFCKYQ